MARAGDVFENAVESVTSYGVSGDPLSVLPTQDALIYIAKGRQLSMTAVARLLRISRETLYQHLRKAHATLSTAAKAGLRLAPPGSCIRCHAEPRIDGLRYGRACWREYRRGYLRNYRARLRPGKRVDAIPDNRVSRG